MDTVRVLRYIILRQNKDTYVHATTQPADHACVYGMSIRMASYLDSKISDSAASVRQYFNVVERLELSRDELSRDLN